MQTALPPVLQTTLHARSSNPLSHPLLPMIRKTLPLILALLFGGIASAQCPHCGRYHQVASSSQGTSNVVSLLNRQRAKMGLYPLRLDPTLQRVAERRATLTAASGSFRGHPPGSFAPGRFEGVGMSSGYSPTAVVACGTYTRKYQSVGAAMVRRNGKSFFAVVYR